MNAAQRQLQPRRRPRQQRAAETRDRLLDAAAHVFEQRGYAAGTTNHIAAAARMSIGSLYQYFPNKDAILVELLRRHIADVTVSLSERLADARLAELELTAMLDELVAAMVTVHATRPRLHQVLFEEAPRPQIILDELRAAEQLLIAAVADLLTRHRQVRLDAQRAEVAARMLTATVESLVHRLVATATPALPPDTVRAEIVVMVRAYLDRRASAPQSRVGPQ